MNNQVQPYLTRSPERLVVGGYRHWLSGCATGSIDHWNAAFAMYSELLGSRNGRVALAALSNFVGTLGRCATCPLRFFPSESDCVCRDECLVLGLVAGIQHGDEDAQHCAVAALACRLRRDEIMAEAGEYALTLKSFGQWLMPVSTDIIAELAFKSSAAAPAPGGRTTVH